MGKNTVYINKDGKAIDKSIFDKSKDCSIEISSNSKTGTWDLLLVCVPTEAMLKAAGDNLADWLVTRSNMAIPYEKGSDISVYDDKVDEFKVVLPSCSIEARHINNIGKAWNEWAKKLVPPADGSDKGDQKKPDQTKSQPTDNQGTKSTPQSTPTPAPTPKPDDPKPDGAQQSGTTPAPAPAPAPASKKHFWDLTDEERIALNKERIAFYRKNG